MSKLKIPSHEAREHTARIRALTHMAQVVHTEVNYWRLRDALSNLPPSNVYQWPKYLDTAWHVARGVCREIEADLWGRQ